jgi:hypothetical protein
MKYPEELLAERVKELEAENERLARAWRNKHANQVREAKSHREYFDKSQRRIHELVAQVQAQAAPCLLGLHPSVCSQPRGLCLPQEEGTHPMTNEAIEAAARDVARLRRELDITNADHIALWIEANTILDEPMNQCASWLACRIVEAHEAAAIALMEEGARLALEAAREEWTDSWTIFDCRIRALDPAAIVKGAGHDRD